jgi:catechol 2,3-dioxygenase-like lactoylglutathione lyase family enzyme
LPHDLSGTPVTTVALRQPTLDDVFLALTGGAYATKAPRTMPRSPRSRRNPKKNNEQERENLMDWKIELIFVPVSDVDRAKAFYVDRIGFNADFDQRVNEKLRFVQLTPPGSACSIAFGEGITDAAPGSLNNVQIVVPNADEARAHLRENGVEASEVDDQPWGRFVTFADPDGNSWTLQELPVR